MVQIQSMLEKQFGFTREQLAPDQALADLGVESLSMVEFMFELENEFSIDLSGSHDQGVPRTVAELVELVETTLAAKVAAGS